MMRIVLKMLNKVSNTNENNNADEDEGKGNS